MGRPTTEAANDRFGEYVELIRLIKDNWSEYGKRFSGLFVECDIILLA